MMDCKEIELTKEMFDAVAKDDDLSPEQLKRVWAIRIGRKHYHKVRGLGVSIEAAYAELNQFFRTYMPS